MPNNADVDEALIGELERLRKVARVRPEQYHVEAADNVKRVGAQKLGIEAQAVAQAAVRRQTRSRRVLDRTVPAEWSGRDSVSRRSGALWWPATRSGERARSVHFMMS
jgi:hypothetical protein